jgi:hypothetical protein
MVHKSSLAEFYGDPVASTHTSWLACYPSSLLNASISNATCRRLLNKYLREVLPPPATQDIEVPDDLLWSASSPDQLRNLAADVSSFVFASWIKKLILKSKIQLVTDAIGEQRFQSALNMRQVLLAESNVFDAAARFNDAVKLHEFFVDVGWECLLQLLVAKHASSAWRFRLIGKKLSQQEPVAWHIRCQPEILLEILPEFTAQEESA